MLVPWEPALPAWEAALFTSGPSASPLGVSIDCLGATTTYNLPGKYYWLPACLPGNCYLPWGACWLFGRSAGCLGISDVYLGVICLGGTVLFPRELALNTWELTALGGLRSTDCPGNKCCLPVNYLPGGTALSPCELVLFAWEAWEALIAWESVLSACELPAWGNSAISLGVSAVCLGITDCLEGLGGGTDCLGISTLCLGTTCLRGNSTSTACLGISHVTRGTCRK